jgi:ferredoxin-NADP reductase/Na+-translocating ferredoxin:NAD+ oxidoreductase RnfD subunit
MLKLVDDFLNRITMYRLLLYYLICLLVLAVSLSAFGALHFSPLAIIVSTSILLVTCWFVNSIFAFIFDAPTNFESAYITALILALIIAPMPSYSLINGTFLVAAGSLAMASKYIFTINRKHIFNPAAIAVVLTALGPRQSANWWVGTTVLLPFVVVGGVLLIRKLRHMQMVLTFFIATLVSTAVYALLSHISVATSLDKTLLSSAMFFLGFVMLTEPLTTPPTYGKRTWYAIIAGLLFPPQVHFLNVYSTPELVLVVSNVFSYIVSPKTKLFPTLKQKLILTPDTLEFVFAPNHKFQFEPGQYMEWTLPLQKLDSRGNRRYFTLASSPTEPSLRLGVKFYDNGSSFKDELLNMSSDTPIVASQLAGDFTMPKDKTQKLSFIAGGIGITPYRSMIKYLLDTGENRDISLLYSAKTTKDFAYRNIFDQAARQIQLKAVYIVSDERLSSMSNQVRSGRIDAQMIQSEVPDYLERHFYISGTQAMVTAMKEILLDLHVPHHQIKVDFFSGYA